ncbi:MAG TPA: DUF4215 domain-containing protein, partial [Polyangiaceae bacterium]|nr:DUF4215 domain-containing protein [Polyangiaceae bacterium]
MFTRASRPVRLGLLCGLLLAFDACATRPSLSESMFDDAGPDVAAPPLGDDGPPAGDSSTTIAVQEASTPDSGASTQDATVDACGATSCVVSTQGYCGDGILQPPETCDDGNSVPADGCSGTCQIEPGWYCPVVGQPCKRLCGNGQLDPGEQCDLGPQNGQAGSGCLTDCQVAPGYACGVPDAGSEAGATGSTGGDSGGASALTDSSAPGPAGADGGGDAAGLDAGLADASLCVAINNCGNGRLDPGEQCDSGPLNGTGGCTSSCTIVPGWRCPEPGFA